MGNPTHPNIGVLFTTTRDDHLLISNNIVTPLYARIKKADMIQLEKTYSHRTKELSGAFLTLALLFNMLCFNSIASMVGENLYAKYVVITFCVALSDLVYKSVILFVAFRKLNIGFINPLSSSRTLLRNHPEGSSILFFPFLFAATIIATTLPFTEPYTPFRFTALCVIFLVLMQSLIMSWINLSALLKYRKNT